jgi:S-adenosylmethionine synthetase
MTTAFVLEALGGVPVAQRRIELVERKGLGHPDMICDALVEAIAVALNRMYLAEAGAILHYNVDKAVLVAGQCRKGFGWGELIQPMRLIVGDRADLEIDRKRLPVEETARVAVGAWLAAHLPHVRPHQLEIHTVLAPGSAELRGIFGGAGGEVLSNDTSGASGYAPLSPTEKLVLEVERFLTGPQFKGSFPDTGEDVKVFAVREDTRVAITVAMPMRCLVTPSEQAYFERKAGVLAALTRRFEQAPFEITWRLNTLDRPGHGADGVYLSLTGTSAEDADSGQVGRGNRANGLIAFSRPSGVEAAPGKNAITHVGKVYSVLSHRLAGLIHVRCPALVEVYVHLAARIGEPVDRPWTAVQVVLPASMGLADVEASIRDVVEKGIAGLPGFRAELCETGIVS